MERVNLKPLKHSTSELKSSICRHLKYTLGQELKDAAAHEVFFALCLSLRDRQVEKMLATEKRFQQAEAKRVYYLSMEFLIGRSLGNNLINLGLFDDYLKALNLLDLDLEHIREIEKDAALGNGGLGRLAACFLDSMATLGIAGRGYGIHYEYGLFRQEIENGYQKERPDRWLAEAWPLKIERDDLACLIPLYGKIAHETDRDGNYNPMWLDWQVIVGVPFDMPIVGYGGRTVNALRLYQARASSDFDIQIFNEGDYFKAVGQKIDSEKISKILYPSDEIATGRELRLVQEYFLVACALRDIVRTHLKHHQDFDDFADRVAIQLNDTHPSLAIAELMRILVDERAVEWTKAWDITRNTMAYTNHTLLPEALEKWPVALFERVLPRHLQIIYEINRRFLDEVSALWPEDNDRRRRMSLIEEDAGKQVRMAHLAVIGSHSVNGVSALHSELLKTELMKDFHDMWPERFNNKTNGITQRRWLLKSNPDLAALLGRTIGDDWIIDLDQLKKLESYCDDPQFQQDFAAVKQGNKKRLAAIIADTTGVRVRTDSLFAIQAKRIHEYKRQLLNVMRIIYEYFGVVENGNDLPVPKTYIFAGKAAPGYWIAKQIIKLIHSVANVINNDPRLDDGIKVVFVPDYRVSLAERMIPAADISEQISTAGYEASGTGNMKFALNGALTVGTMDGANIEIRQEVGEDNIYIFGLTAEEIAGLVRDHAYDPGEYYREHEDIRRVMNALGSERFSPGEFGLHRWSVERLLQEGDRYFHLADFHAYVQAHEKAAADFGRPALWTRKAILNTARIGRFSSDRTIFEYARDIWKIEPEHYLKTGS